MEVYAPPDPGYKTKVAAPKKGHANKNTPIDNVHHAILRHQPWPDVIKSPALFVAVDIPEKTTEADYGDVPHTPLLLPNVPFQHKPDRYTRTQQICPYYPGRAPVSEQARRARAEARRRHTFEFGVSPNSSGYLNNKKQGYIVSSESNGSTEYTVDKYNAKAPLAHHHRLKMLRQEATLCSDHPPHHIHHISQWETWSKRNWRLANQTPWEIQVIKSSHTRDWQKWANFKTRHRWWLADSTIYREAHAETHNASGNAQSFLRMYI